MHAYNIYFHKITKDNILVIIISSHITSLTKSVHDDYYNIKSFTKIILNNVLLSKQI